MKGLEPEILIGLCRLYKGIQFEFNKIFHPLFTVSQQPSHSCSLSYLY